MILLHLGFKLLDRDFSIVIDIQLLEKINDFFSRNRRVDDSNKLFKTLESELCSLIETHIAHQFSEF